ncbi:MULTISPECIES: DNA polymerase III subunit alpha [unclassified Granulicatella]|uniref:DNA polymerase III subunit alpha n=1 Tax=unclassified Granulicatella TaxID=2630493 RepID=UPI0010741B72|nr:MULTISPECIES: DNA polymerase III subunit alpha [unclassified Granulicatella]MBF0780868.1 DNA polymerase III subunit alpha [Granulicatella sp. 19428wC4_WM01]TFU93479.1 DNA polymerase III subunit alpha [Granulicatella sp. WM01]
MFTPLQVYSANSLLKSPMSVKQYVADAFKKGYTTLVLSEWKTLSSSVEFIRLCQEKQLKALIGLEIPWKHYTLQLLALNTTGYFELVDLSSRLLSNQTFLLSDYPNIACILTQIVSLEHLEELREYCKERVYVAVQVQEIELYEWANKYTLPMLANKRVMYANPSDYRALKILNAIETNDTLNRMSIQDVGKDYLPKANDFKYQFEQEKLGQIIQNTQAFYDCIELNIPVQQTLLPKFSERADDLLKEIAFKGLRDKQLDTSIYVERLHKELAIIAQMKFSDYFLIVWDLMKYAHKEGIMTGAGRGSSAASLVSYCLNITKVDPIKHHLLFERFLNPERYTMPDIDLDFPDNKRQDMLHYVAQKYGYDKVAQISTFGTFAAKQSLRDVARVFGFSPKELKQISDMVPFELKITLNRALEQSTKLKQWIEKSELNQEIFQLACKIEGLPRHVSTHAAGVVISDKPLSELTPVQHLDGQIQLTQMTMQDVEYIGLLKMDFLGLKNLSILADAQTAVRQFEDQFDIWHIDWQDEQTLQVFARADTEGIFQFESTGIRRVLEQIKPQSLEEVAAVNALYRPGPMEQIGHYALRKHKREQVSYPHKDLQPILEETYGIIVYQEQVMQIAYQMAGFSLGEADLLRRAIGKMKKDVMASEKVHFITGAQKRGYSLEDATTVYQYIEKFANYGFPKSHALAYSMLAYQLAYIKAYYPQAFYLALLLHTNAKSERFTMYLMEAKRHGIEAVVPSINQSQSMHRILSNKRILFGLSAIQGIRRDMRQYILDERKRGGKFTSFDNFIDRMPDKYTKDEYLETLIYAGVFDEFGETRSKLINNISVTKTNKNLLDKTFLTPIYEEVVEIHSDVLMEKEKEILGFSVSTHELDKYAHYYDKQYIQFSHHVLENDYVYLLGYLKKIRKIQTKNGKRMAFAVLEDQFAKISLTIFPEVYTRHIAHFEEDTVIVVSGRIDLDNRGEKICVVNTMYTLHDFEQKIYQKEHICFIKVKNIAQQQLVIKELVRHKGDTPVVMYLEDTQQYHQLPEKYNINFQKQLQDGLAFIVGEDNIVYKKRKNV